MHSSGGELFVCLVCTLEHFTITHSYSLSTHTMADSFVIPKEMVVEEAPSVVARVVTETKEIAPGITRKMYNVPLKHFDTVTFKDIPRAEEYDEKLDELVDKLRDVCYFVAAELALGFVAGPGGGNYLDFVFEDEDATKIYHILDKYWQHFEVHVQVNDRDYILLKPRA